MTIFETKVYYGDYHLGNIYHENMYEYDDFRGIMKKILNFFYKNRNIIMLNINTDCGNVPYNQWSNFKKKQRKKKN